MDWYYALNEKQVGPVSIEMLKSLIEKETLSAEDYVWNENLGDDWVCIAEVSELCIANHPGQSLTPAEEEMQTGDEWEDESMDEEIPTGGYKVEEIAYHISVRLAEGKSKHKILRELSENNVPEKVGFQLINQVNKMRHSEYRSTGLMHIFLGIGSIIAGLALTFGLSSVLGMVGFGVVFYGLIIAGVLELLNGLRYLIFGALRLAACIPILAILLITGALVVFWFYNIPSTS